MLNLGFELIHDLWIHDPGAAKGHNSTQWITAPLSSGLAVSQSCLTGLTRVVNQKYQYCGIAIKLI